MRFHVRDELAGKNVLSSDGRDIGEVKDAVIDAVSWRVLAVIVRLDRSVLDDLRMKKPLLGSHDLRVAAHDIASVSDRMLLKRPLADYARMAEEQEQKRADDKTS